MLPNLTALRRYVRTPVLLMLCLSLSTGSLAQTNAASPPALSLSALLSMDDLVGLVLANNPSLKTNQRGVDMARAAVTTAGALPNPRLEMNGGRNTSSSVPSGLVSGFSVSQVIENPGLRSARINSALFAEEGSQQTLAQTRNELVGQVKLRAYEYLLRREEAQAAADALSLIEQTRERIKVRVETGETGRYELIKAESEIVNARQREETARLQIAQAEIALKRLAAGRLPESWSLDAELAEIDAFPSLPALKQAALRDNPELKVLASEFERNQSRLAEANASRLPGIELRLSHLNEPEVRQDILGISMQIPLFDQKQGPRAEAIAERERTRERLEGRQAELLQQLELAWRSVEIAKLRVKALSEGAIRSAEAALQVSEAAYRFGERGILEVLDAQRVLRAVRQDLLLARFQLQASLIELDTLAGRYAGN